MRIALIHYQLKRGGGMESYLVDLIRGFAAAGDDVDVWTRARDDAFAAGLPAVPRRVRVPPLPRLFRNRAFSHAVERLRLVEHYDLVLSLARTVGQDVFISGGDHRGFLQATHKRPTLKDRYEVRLEARALEQSRVVIAHSKRLKQEYETLYGCDGSRIHVVYPPVDVTRFIRAEDHQRQMERERLGLHADEFAFLFPSTGHERKGLPALLEAFSRLEVPPARLLIAGRAARVGTDARIRSLGYVNDMPALYSAVDCTVLPSIYEPFGLVIAESLQCGTPTITAADSGVAELMEAGDGLRLEDCSAPTILEALQKMLEGNRGRPESGWAVRHGLAVEAHIAQLRQLCQR